MNFIKNNIKLTSIALFLLISVLYWSANVSAQTGEVLPPSPIVYPYAPCSAATQVSSALIQYESFAAFYIKLMPEVWTDEHTVWISSKDGSFQEIYLTNGSELVVPKLPLNQEFIVSARNSCEDRTDIMTFKTTQNKEAFVGVSNDLFNILGEWTRGKIDLYDFLESAEGGPLDGTCLFYAKLFS